MVVVGRPAGCLGMILFLSKKSFETISGSGNAHEKRTTAPSIKTKCIDQIFQNEICRFTITGPGLLPWSWSKGWSKLSVSTVEIQLNVTYLLFPKGYRTQWSLQGRLCRRTVKMHYHLLKHYVLATVREMKPPVSTVRIQRYNLNHKPYFRVPVWCWLLSWMRRMWQSNLSI